MKTVCVRIVYDEKAIKRWRYVSLGEMIKQAIVGIESVTEIPDPDGQSKKEGLSTELPELVKLQASLDEFKIQFDSNENWRLFNK